MASSVAVSGIDRVPSTSATSRSTSWSTLSVVMLAARIWRCASARTCQICQVERCSSIAASTRSAAAATQSASIVGLDRVGGVKGGVHHGVHGLRSAENLGGLVVPGGPLLGQGAGFVLGVPGLQGGLLRQMQHLHRSRWPTMITLKPGRQLTLPVLDTGPPRRPAPVQRRVDTDDLPYRPQPRIGVGSFREPDTEGVAEVVFQGGVVGLRRSHRRLEQHPSVDGQPASVEGLHLVRNRDMGVQIRVAGSGVAVGERGRDQAGHVDLPDPVPALPGEQCVAFDEGQRILHRSLVRPFDLCGDVRVGDRPQASTPT